MIEDTLLTALRLITEVGEEYGRPEEIRDLDLAKLLKDVEQRVKFHYCVPCQLAGSWPRQSKTTLQEHHIAGKVLNEPNFHDTVTVCNRCHDYLSDHQRAWLVHRKDSATCLSCYFFGWGDLFDLLSNKSGLIYFGKLGSRFRAEGHYIRNKLHQRRYLAKDLTITC